MRSCRIERPARRYIVVLTASLLGIPPASAQLGPPVSLVPAPAGPREGSVSPAPRGDVPAPIPNDDDIKAQPLAPTDSSWAGTLHDDQGALPATLWRGTARGFVVAALPLLAPSTSPALHDLARRLLLSNATSPAGQDPPDRPSLAATRLDRLLALGDVTGAQAILDQLPADPNGDNLDRTQIELRFAAGDGTGACGAVEDRIARYQNLWWDRALIACQALAGDSAKAALGLSLLKEQKAAPDPTFDALIETLGGRPHKIDKLSDPTPLRLTLLAAAKLPLPQDALAAAGPGALLAYASSTAPPAETRLAAAESAALLGALPPEQLGALYQQIDLRPEDEVATLKDGKLPDNPKSRAILYTIARSNAPADKREAAMTALLGEARRRGAFPVTARLLAPALDELTPAGASPAFAGEAARILLVTGAGEAALPWLDAAGGAELRVLRRLAGAASGDPRDATGLLRDSIAELANRDSAAASAQAGLLVALLAGFDERVAAPDWAPLLAPPHEAKLPSAALLIDQQQAAADQRIGETVLTTVLLLQDGERLSLEPVLLGHAIAGLRAIGQDGAARALAVEAAVDAGI